MLNRNVRYLVSRIQYPASREGVEVFLNVLGYGILAGVSTVAGTLLILFRYEWAKRNSTHLMSFAAGIMLALAFLHLIPEATHTANEANIEVVEEGHEGEAYTAEAEHAGGEEFVFIIILLGIIIFYAIESAILIHPRHNVEAEKPHKHGTLSILSITGLTFHSVIDGVVIAVGFKAGYQIGIMTTMAVILHEMPEGIITTSILLHDAMERARVFWFSLLVALATPFGAIASYFILGGASETLLRILLAFAAGSFIYIAAADLIPETHRGEKRLNTVALILGMASLYFIGRLLGHGY